jgi:hypothetical protein
MIRTAKLLTDGSLISFSLGGPSQPGGSDHLEGVLGIYFLMFYAASFVRHDSIAYPCAACILGFIFGLLSDRFAFGLFGYE